ncbi:MAG: DNA polymerase III subunit delta [Bacteroidota bacterium]|nr:DNA polymerase III subunit delta [Bacteroidota bacterium]
MRFTNIIGQLEIKNKLIRTVQEQRVSHAQLFFGPEGNEKLALAIAYAQYINCSNRKDLSNKGPLLGDSCGECPSCIQFQKMVHPDLHFIYPVATTKKVTRKARSIDFIAEWREFLLKNDYHVTLPDWYEHIGIENKQGIINVEDCNSIIQELSYKSYESEYKVMIIWMAERLFHAAAPKLLKILEEPPEKTLFLLITEDPDQLISTIRSRSLPVKIPKLTETDIREYLVSAYNTGEKEAGILARQSKGNLKQALNRLQKTEEKQFNFLTFRDWMRICFVRDVPKAIAVVAELAKIGRENQKSLLQYGLSVFEACAQIHFKQGDNLPYEGEEFKFIHDFSPFINPDNIAEFTKLFETAIQHIERNAYAQALFMDLSLHLMNLFQIAYKAKRK